jgi:hypothetical protein
MPEHTLKKAPQPLTVAELIIQLERIPPEMRHHRILVRGRDEKDKFLHSRVYKVELCSEIEDHKYDPPLLRIVRD